jgi:hypothetical protein
VSQCAEVVDGDGFNANTVDAGLSLVKFDLARRNRARDGRPFCCVADDNRRDFVLRRRFVLRHLFGRRGPIGVDLRGLGVGLFDFLRGIR